MEASPQSAREVSQLNSAAEAFIKLTYPRSVPEKWLAEFGDQESALALADYHRRLASDEQLIHDLQWESFNGPRWNELAIELVRYGFQVFRAWLVTGRVFSFCDKNGLKGITKRWALQRARPADIDDLVAETVHEAVMRFRSKVLIPGRWKAERGATLPTFFIGQALIVFVGVYQAWVRSATAEEPVDGANLLDLLSPFEDPERAAIDRLTLREALRDAPRDVRSIAILRAEGHSFLEIAHLLDLPSAKSAEMKLYRYRERMRQRV